MEHPFRTWMVATHLKTNSPVGDLACDLKRWTGFPKTGGRQELHDFLANEGAEQWALQAFNEAWLEYDAACLSPGCPDKVAPGSSYCSPHGGRRHHPEAE